MHKRLMLFLVVLTSAVWLHAQAYPQSSPTQTGGSKTVQGCLQGSGGSYNLTADSGTVYQLIGNTSELSAHVGHEVEITGKSSGSIATGSATAAGESQQATLDVKSMKHIAKTCKNAAK